MEMLRYNGLERQERPGIWRMPRTKPSLAPSISGQGGDAASSASGSRFEGASSSGAGPSSTMGSQMGKRVGKRAAQEDGGIKVAAAGDVGEGMKSKRVKGSKHSACQVPHSHQRHGEE